MTAITAALEDLRRRRAEWAPWLAIVAAVAEESGTPACDAAVPAATDAGDTVVPRLAGSTIAIHRTAVRGFLDRLLRRASGVSPKMATVQRAIAADVDVLQLFAASVSQDAEPVEAVAAASRSDPEALQSIVSLLAVPFMHACARRFAPSLSASWVQGYCPVCGSWPAFAEVRGIERTRSYRCGRCGADWHARALCCPYCEMIEHDELVSLIAEKSELNATIDACNRCRGYVKVFTTLQGCPPEAALVEDLASVELDLAAIDAGYARPPRPGYDLAVRVIEDETPRRWFGWKS